MKIQVTKYLIKFNKSEGELRSGEDKYVYF